MRFQAILFDMDGVLIDSEELMAKSAILALRDFGVEAKPADFEPFVGQGEDRYVGGVAKLYGKEYDFAMKERAYDYFGERVKAEAKVPDGCKAVLETLKAAGYKMAVCSSADRRKVLYNLSAIGVEEAFFDAFITGSEVVHKKPDPEIYLKGAVAVGCAAKDCIVVEDSPSGILAAHAGGMQAVGIASTFTKEYLQQTAQPDYLIGKLSELPEILK